MHKFLLLFILIICFWLRLLFLSPWLEDWDSVQFALAIHDFSISEHQPHAPGYPIYVLLARFFYVFTQNDTLALTLLSATFGTATIIPLYLITKHFFGKFSAFTATALFTVIPIGWMMSISALTNMPGLFFLTLWAYLILVWAKTPKKLLLTSFFGGLILGVRFTELPIILAILIFVLLRNEPKHFIRGILSFILGVLTWLGPLIFKTGLHEFIESYTWIANYVIIHDSHLDNRIERLIYLLKIGYTQYFLIASLMAFIWVFLNKKFWTELKYQLIIIWLVAYSVPLTFIYNLEVPRYTLPLLPPLVILVATFTSSIIKRSLVRIFMLIILASVMFYEGFSQVKSFSNSLPPTIAAVNYVRDNFKPEDTLIITTFSYRQFQYYAPNFKVFYGDEINALDIPQDKTVIIDYSGLKNEVGALSSLTTVESKTFLGNRDIFPRISELTLYILRGENYGSAE